MNNVDSHFLKNLKAVFSEHGKSHVPLNVVSISAQKSNTKAYCFRSADNIIIYMRSRETFLNSRYARISNEVYKNLYFIETTLFNTNPFTEKRYTLNIMCRDQCLIDRLNSNRNSTQKVVLIKSKAEISRNQNMPVWLIEKSGDMLTFNIEACFE